MNTNQELRMENILSFRSKMTHTQVQQELNEIDRFIQLNKLSKSGPSVTVTYSIEDHEGQQLLDTEVLIPICEHFTETEKYKCKNLFHLKGAIKARHNGNPQLLGNTINTLLHAIHENKWHQLTPVYCVNVKELPPNKDFNKMVIDTYIGVSTSIL